MRIGRTILAYLVATSLAIVPMAGAFVVPGDEPIMSDVVAGSAHEGCDHQSIASEEVVGASAHDCCDQSMPADNAMKGCPASADCIAKCFSFYGVLFSEEAIPPPTGGTESRFVSNPFHSQRGSPPFRPPRV
jgi:hypothetical protein